MPCSDVVKSISYRAAVRLDVGIANTPSGSGVPHAKPDWGVQLVAVHPRTALASFQQLQKVYKTLLETRQPLVIQSKVGTSGSWYRVRVVSDSRADAERLCSGLRAPGGSCLVQRN